MKIKCVLKSCFSQFKKIHTQNAKEATHRVSCLRDKQCLLHISTPFPFRNSVLTEREGKRGTLNL